jgi:hypothetical protein
MTSLSKRLLPAMAAAMLYVPMASGAEIAPLIDAHVDVINGGIGKEEAEFLRAQAAAFPLEIVFTRRADGNDEFVADVNLLIVNAQGYTIVSGPAGPIFLARLPDGQYTITAEYRGQTQTRRVAIAGGQHQKLALVWS